MKNKSSGFRRALCLACVLPFPALAQQAPNAGTILQENAPTLQPPAVDQEVRIEKPEAAPPSGGASALIRSVEVTGNTLIPTEVLVSSLGKVAGQTFDFAALTGLASRISNRYQAAGYPFVRAYLPPQDLSTGVLKIRVVEGRYGKIATGGTSPYADDAQKFLFPLESGAMIESAPLERVSLILSDLPGISTTPIIRPGQEVGTGDLLVRVESGKPWGMDVGIDNYGNRYTGRNQANINADINSPFMLGDQITLKGLYTDEQMWFGNLGYSLPLGAAGMRGQFAYTRTYYMLAKDFSDLDASGTADVFYGGISYPFVRSQALNLSMNAGLQHKILDDKQDAVDFHSRKHSTSLPLALNFDLRDTVAGGGITYGAFTYTHGNLDLDSAAEAIDKVTAKTSGSFDKANLDVARLQSVISKLTFSARVSAQWAGNNLDSSEKFGLGGVNGVRAYPSGEAYGDEGWLAQLELRYSINAFTPYVFHDSGAITINKNTWTSGDNHRSIAGAGIGVRYQQANWKGDLAIAWKTLGDKAQSDTHQENPIIWASIQYQF